MLKALRRAWATVDALVFGSDPKMATLLRFGLLPAALHGLWGSLYALAAYRGEMNATHAQWMIATNVVGIVGFYPWIRSGLTKRLRHSSLILWQMLWGSVTTSIALALVPSLRPAMLEILCLIQVFGFFSLRPRPLAWIGGTSIGLLGLLVLANAADRLPLPLTPADLGAVLITVTALSLLTLITMNHSRRRGRLVQQRRALEAAMAAVQELVFRDGLTGLYSRRHMETVLGTEQARAERSGVPFSVALIDLDHFKRINDSFGHGTGDQVLQAFAQTAQKTLRSTDATGRWGGEEFLVIAPGQGDEAPPLEVQLRRLRDVYLSMPPANAALPRHPSFSAGVATWQPGESTESVVARADRALYEAKRQGRDRVVQADAASNGLRPAADAADAGQHAALR